MSKLHPFWRLKPNRRWEGSTDSRYRSGCIKDPPRYAFVHVNAGAIKDPPRMAFGHSNAGSVKL